MAANTDITDELSAALGDNAPVKQLLHVGDDSGSTSTSTQVYDADGTATGLYVGTAGFSGITPLELVTDDKILTVADSGKIFTIATDAKTFTLPSTAAGLTYTFVCTAADGGALVSISPATADGIFGTITLAASVVQMAGTANTDVDLTKSTQLKGDSITLVGDGVDGWAIVASTGIWASE